MAHATYIANNLIFAPIHRSIQEQMKKQIRSRKKSNQRPQFCRGTPQSTLKKRKPEGIDSYLNALQPEMSQSDDNINKPSPLRLPSSNSANPTEKNLRTPKTSGRCNELTLAQCGTSICNVEVGVRRCCVSRRGRGGGASGRGRVALLPETATVH